MRTMMTTLLMTAMIALGATALGGCEDKPAVKTPEAPAGAGGAPAKTPDPIVDEAAKAAEEAAARHRTDSESKEPAKPTEGEADKAKQEAVEKVEEKVSWFRKQLDVMKEKSATAAAAADEKWDAAVAKAEQSYDAAKAKLATAKEAGADAWAAAKPELDEAVTQLNEAYEKAKAAWSAKFAPTPTEAKPTDTPAPIEPTK